MTESHVYLGLLDSACSNVQSGCDYQELRDRFFNACQFMRCGEIIVDDLIQIAEAALSMAVDISGRSPGSILAYLRELHINKNAGYSGADNPDTWANFRLSERLGIPPFSGCMVRLSDKVERIGNLIRDPNNERVNESIFDTLCDSVSYSLIAACLLIERNEKNAR